MLSEQRSAKARHRTASEPSSSAPTPASNHFVAERGKTIGIEQERVAANQAIREKLWETHLRQVVRTSEPTSETRSPARAGVPSFSPWFRKVSLAA